MSTEPPFISPQSISDEVYDESRYTPEARRIMDDDQLRREALGVRDTHDPAKQDHNYDRCEHCHYTSHPCDAYDMANTVLELLDRDAPDEYFS